MSTRISKNIKALAYEKSIDVERVFKVSRMPLLRCARITRRGADGDSA